MSEGYYLHLQPSEAAVFEAAANIFASYVGLAEKALCCFSLCDQWAQAAAFRTVGS